MPIYEYRCDGCGKTFEVRQKFADAALTTHDECGAPVKRLISAPALQFKGSGFYITDYAKGNNSSGPPKSSGGKALSEGSSDSKSAKSETKTESKSESKSEAKTESKPAPAATPSTSSSDKK